VRAIGLLRTLGLGLAAGAVFHGAAAAQDTTRARPPRDTVRVPIPLPADSAAADSARRARAGGQADSATIARARAAADTIKAPLARGEAPQGINVAANAYRWSREELLASGNLTLADLVAQVPGVTTYQGGWLVTPHLATYFGDFRPVRVFRDGVELDPLDARTGIVDRRGGMVDLSLIPIWSLEEVVIEQGAQELRVHLRSWRVARTTPFTRVDISTGDLETNTYRGYFGRRFGQGAGLQLGAQQFSTSEPRLGGDGDQLGIFGRLGWARGRWSVDALYESVHRTRNVTRSRQGAGLLAATDTRRIDAYARLGYGDPERGPWAQLIAATMSRSETGTNSPSGGSTGVGGGLPADSADTTNSRAQYILTGGLTRGPFRASIATRLRSYEEQTFISPSARLAYDRRWMSVSLFGERRSEDASYGADIGIRLTPFRFLSLAGGASRYASDPVDSLRPTTTALRAEAGLRLGRIWFTGGIVRRDSAVIPGPVVFDTAFKSVLLGPTTTLVATVRGPIYKAVNVDVVALRADEGAIYQPQYHVRSRLYVSTPWLSRFPTGNFHIRAGVGHEYRTGVLFPVSQTELRESSQYRSISALLEIRLLDAVLSYQFRNVLGAIYEQVPGLEMPRQMQVYGVRWEFFN
jgi:hypothetical protein